MIREHLDENLKIQFTYFLPDNKKSGGRYVTVVGIVKKIDEYKKCFILTSGQQIPIEDISDISKSL